MKISDYEYYLIQEHLRNKLLDEERIVFENKLKTSTVFAEVLKEEQALHTFLKQVIKTEIEQEVSEGFIEEKNNTLKKKRLIIISVVTLTLFSFLMYNTFNTSDKESQTKQVNQPKQKTLAPFIFDSTVSNSNDIKIKTTTSTNTKLKDISDHYNPESNSLSTPPCFVNKLDSLIDTVSKFKSDLNIQKQDTIEKHLNNNQIKNVCNEVKIEVNYHVEEPCLFGTEGYIEIDAEGGDEPYICKLNKNDYDIGLIERLKKGDYTILVSDANSCISEPINITVDNKKCYDVPLAFNPNIDNWVYETNNQLVTLKIMSRFGKELYQTEEENPSWNGKHHNGTDLPTDDYIYIIYIDNLIIDKGNVTLVRE